MIEILMTLVAAIGYMFLFWLPKRVRKENYESLSPKKVLRTVIWGLILGVILTYYEIAPTVDNMETYISLLMGYGTLVAIVDKTTLFVHRLVIERLLEKYRALEE